MNRPIPDGQDAIFSTSEDSALVSERTPKSTHIVIVGGIAIFIALAALISAIVVYACTGGTIPFDNGIVIDAGSSHTQAILYQWLGSKQNGTGDVIQQAECTYESGIASLPNPAVIAVCAENVTKLIPDTGKASSPLYLAATAGMRLLNLTKPDVVRLILLDLDCALKKIGVDVREVKVISGFDEGLYSWITVNFLKKTLYTEDEQQDTYTAKTYGSLDMGGASTEISFAVDSKSNSSTTSLKLYGHEHTVFSTSFLCFGVNEARNRHQALLIKDLNSSEPVTDPCMPKGNKTIVNANRLLGEPCTTTDEFEEWLQIKSHRLKNFTFEGSSNYEECERGIENLIDNTACKDKGFSMCTEKVTIPNRNMKFMAFSSFYYVTDFLNATNASLTDFRTITKDWCSLSWQNISDRSFNPKIFKHLSQYCFGASFITKWLTDVCSFNEESWNNIAFQQKVANTEVGWALGMMINATNAVPAEKPTSPFLSKVVFIIILICCSFIAILGILLTHQYCKEKLNFSGFTRLNC